MNTSPSLLPLTLTLALAATQRAQVVLPERIEVPGEFKIRSPSEQEQALLADARDGKLDQFDLLTATLIASGVPDAALNQERAAVKEALQPAIDRARQVTDERVRGRVLLAALHDTVLRRYDMATTEVHHVLQSGTFNCLSASALFAVAAEGLLEAPRAVFTSRHAYARVQVYGKPVDVETTIARGFDPKRNDAADIARTRALFPDGLKSQSDAQVLEGLRDARELPPLAFVAGIYANRGIGLVQDGDLEGAATAFDRGTRVAPPQLRERIARWRAGLLEAAARSLLDAKRPEDARVLLTLAFDGVGAEDRARLSYNLGVTLLHLARKAAEEDRPGDAVVLLEEAIARGINDPESRAALATARGELASLTGDASVCTGSGDERGRCLARLSLRAAQKESPEAAMAHARAALAAAPRDPEVRTALFYALWSRAESDTSKGECVSAEAAAREAELYVDAVKGSRPDPKRLIGACLAKAASNAYAHKRWDEAEQLFRRARFFLPQEASLAKNLGAACMAKAIENARALRCDDARADVGEARTLHPDLEPQATRVLAVCWANKAIQLASEARHREAVAASRLGLREAPDDAVLQKNLGIFLHNWTVSLLRKKDCAEARSLLPELNEPALESTKRSVLRQCPAT